jgi:hypothetical protein
MTTQKTRPELGELKAGQQVMVLQSPNGRRRQPPEEWYIPAVVTKVARVWIELEKSSSEPLPQWSIYRWRMRRDTQDEGSQYSGNNASFVTLEQHAWDETRRWGLQVLSDNGIKVERGSPWHGREAELADLITKSTENTEEATS